MVHPGPEVHEDLLRPSGGIVEGILGRSRDEIVGEQRPGSHLQVWPGTSDGRHRCRSDDLQLHLRADPRANYDGVADVLAQLGQGDGTEHDLSACAERVSGQDRGLHRGVRALADNRNGLSVDVQVV